VKDVLLFARTATHLRWSQVLDRPLRTLKRRCFVGRAPNDLSLARAPVAIAAAWAHADHRFVVDMLDGRDRRNTRPELTDSTVWRRRHASTSSANAVQQFEYAIGFANAARATGDGRFGRSLLELIRGWIAANPDRTAEGWDAFRIAHRTGNWIRAAALLDADAISLELQEAMTRSIWAQSEQLRQNLEYHVAGNHLLKNLTALSTVSLAIDSRASARRRAFALPRLWEEIVDQVLDDGAHVERSPMYAVIGLADCLEVVAWCDARGETVPRDIRERLRKMYDSLGLLMRPDGTLHAFNDCCRSSPVPLPVLFTLARAALGGGMPQRREGPMSLADAGYFGYSHGADRLFIDCGALGPSYQPGHGHCDLLSFELDLAGSMVIVDSGTSDYMDARVRQHQRSTAAHNTLELNGLDQAELWSTYRVARRPEVRSAAFERDSFAFHGAYSPYHEPRLVHRRSFELRSAGDYSFVDSVEGCVQSARGFLHFHPDFDARIEDRRVILNRRSGGLQVAIESEDWSDLRLVRGALAPPQGWYALGDERRVPSFALEYAPFSGSRQESRVTIRAACTGT
jgi:hypothetical protein